MRNDYYGSAWLRIYTKMQSARRINIQNAPTTDDDNWRVIMNEYLHYSINLSLWQRRSTISVVLPCSNFHFHINVFSCHSAFVCTVQFSKQAEIVVKTTRIHLLLPKKR